MVTLCAEFERSTRDSCFAGDDILASRSDPDFRLEAREAEFNPLLGRSGVYRGGIGVLTSAHSWVLRITEAIPQTPRRVSLVSVAIAGVLILSIWPVARFASDIETHVPRQPQVGWLHHLVNQYYGDAVFLQCLSGLILMYVSWKLAQNLGFRGLYAAMIAAAFVGSLLLISFALTKLYLKPGLSFDRPEGYISSLEGPLTQKLGEWLGLGPEKGIPSGFVLRQTVLSMGVIWVSLHRESGLGRIESAVIYLVSGLMLAVMSFLRFYVGSHNLIDTVLGIGVGILTFWVITIPFSSVINFKVAVKKAKPRLLQEEPLRALRWVTAVWLAFTFFMFFYAGDPARWLLGTVVIVTILLLLTWYLERGGEISLRKGPSRGV